MQKARIREHEAFENDIEGSDCISDEILLKWSREPHSVSGHLLTMYSIVRGTHAKVIVEVGFGRSSKVFSRAAVENGADFFCCDRNNHQEAFSEKEMSQVQFICGLSCDLWTRLDREKREIDFAFLDFFSGKGVSVFVALLELHHCMRLLRVGGIVCIHDVCDARYPVRRLPFWVRFLGGIDAVVLPHSQGLLMCRKRSRQYGTAGILLVHALLALQWMKRLFRTG